jgi:hypothetical protein
MRQRQVRRSSGRTGPPQGGEDMRKAGVRMRLGSRLMWAVLVIGMSFPLVALHEADVFAGPGLVSQGGCEVPGNVVQNCGFEAGLAAPWVESNNTPGTDGVWLNSDTSSTDTGPYEYRFGEPTAPGSSLSQTLTVTPHTGYLLQFELNASGSPSSLFTTTISGTSTGTQSFAVHAGGGFPFNPKAYQFTSGAATTVTLTFAAYSQAGPLHGTYFDIDDVMVTPKHATGTVANVVVSPQYGARTAVNQAVVATAEMIQTPSGAPMGGTVAFFFGSNPVPVAVVPVANLRASATITTASEQVTQLITAVYSGDADNDPVEARATYPSVASCGTTLSGPQQSLVVTAGTTCLQYASVSGNITVSNGAALDIEGSTVSGRITANGSGPLRICGTTTGPLVAQSANGFVLVGDPSEACEPNTINGNAVFASNNAGVVAFDNQITGTLFTPSNTGAGPLRWQTGPMFSGNHP